MKIFTFLLVLGVLVCPSVSQSLCIICTPFITVPDNWPLAQLLLNTGCSLISGISGPCIGLMNSMNLTSSWPTMYPFIISLREQACKSLCPA